MWHTDSTSKHITIDVGQSSLAGGPYMLSWHIPGGAGIADNDL